MSQDSFEEPVEEEARPEIRRNREVFKIERSESAPSRQPMRSMEDDWQVKQAQASMIQSQMQSQLQSQLQTQLQTQLQSQMQSQMPQTFYGDQQMQQRYWQPPFGQTYMQHPYQSQPYPTQHFQQPFPSQFSDNSSFYSGQQPHPEPELPQQEQPKPKEMTLTEFPRQIVIERVTNVQQLINYQENPRFQNSQEMEDAVFENIKCLICCTILIDPKDCPGCDFSFCSGCIADYFRADSQKDCPNGCKGPIQMKKVHKQIRQKLSSLKIKCCFAPLCTEVVSYEGLANHQLECHANRMKCPNYSSEKSASGEIEYTGCKSYFRLQEKEEHLKMCAWTKRKLEDPDQNFSCDLCHSEQQYSSQAQLAQHKLLECEKNPEAFSKCPVCHRSMTVAEFKFHFDLQGNNVLPHKNLPVEPCSVLEQNRNDQINLQNRWQQKEQQLMEKQTEVTILKSQLEHNQLMMSIQQPQRSWRGSGMASNGMRYSGHGY